MGKSFYSNDGVWLKANIHSHTTVSDGAFTPLELGKLYAEAGYDVLSMTDHNLFVPHSELPKDMILLPTGVEHDIEYSPNKCTHIIGIGAKGKVSTTYDCRRYSKDELSDQQLINMMKNDGQFVVLAHPFWSRMKPDEVLTLNNFDAIEVYNNGTEHLCHHGNAEIYWELLLQQGKRIFATACDDVHCADDLFGGWIWLKARNRTSEAVIDALHEGHFYASSGPKIFDFHVENNEVYISCSPCREIHFVAYEPRGKSFFAEEKQELTEGKFTLKKTEKYVRAVCVDFNGKTAWTNPIYFDM